MTLQQLRYAMVVAQTGSMNKAAESLFISQPTLTNTIRGLEEESGITIFNRTNKGVDLTAEGSDFLFYAKKVCDQYDQLIWRYDGKGNARKVFSVSTQHYSFVCEAFSDTSTAFMIIMLISDSSFSMACLVSSEDFIAGSALISYRYAVIDRR